MENQPRKRTRPKGRRKNKARKRLCVRKTVTPEDPLQNQECKTSKSPKPSKHVALDRIWDEIMATIVSIYARIAFSYNHYMKIYTYIYHYCTTFNYDEEKREYRPVTGVKLKGFEMYKRIRDYIRSHLFELMMFTEEMSDLDALMFYARRWDGFQFSSNVLNGLGSMLNRCAKIVQRDISRKRHVTVFSLWFYDESSIAAQMWKQQNKEGDQSSKSYRQWVRKENRGRKKVIYDLYELSMLTWRDNLFCQLHKKVTSALLELIEKERLGEPVPTGLLRLVIESYVMLGMNDDEPSAKVQTLKIYKEEFEDHFLRETERFYAVESTEFLSRHPLNEYLKKVEQRLSEEHRRVQLYLHESTGAKLSSICDKVLIKKHLQLFPPEFKTLLEQDRNEDVGRLFYLASRVQRGTGELQALLEHHIFTQGVGSLERTGGAAFRDPKVYVHTILDTYAKFNELVTTSFRSDHAFVGSLDKAMRKLLNNNPVTKAANSSAKSAELIASFCDVVLRKSSRNIDEAELESTLSQVMIIFKYIEDKDVFQKFYYKMLAKRLVQNNSASDDAEAWMITKLKMACGFEYTSRLQRMFQDVGVCRDLNERFKKYLKNKKYNSIECHVQILSSGAWPFQMGTPVSLPSQLERAVSHFAAFYNSLHNGRKLNWIFSMSKGELTANCFKRRYTFQASTYQMAILLLFNSSKSWTVRQIKESTQLEMDFAVTIIKGLIEHKLLLANDPENLRARCKITLNDDYKNKKVKVNINTPIKSETKAEEEATNKTIEEDRKVMIQAAIVRVMKTRQFVKHQQLIAEILNMMSSRFKPKVSVIKKCIDKLIDKEYIARDKNHKGGYCYLA